MKLQELMESTGNYVYHVTFTEKVPSIKKEGIKPLQTSNWAKAGNPSERYNEEGGVFAFEHPEDAFKWAFKQQFEFKKPTSIIKLKGNDSWKEDPTQDIMLTTGKGRPLRSKAAIPASDVVKAFKLDDFKSPTMLGIPQSKWIDHIVKTLEV